MSESKKSSGSEQLDARLQGPGAAAQFARDIEAAPSMVHRWRMGKQKPSYEFRKRIRRKLRISMDAWDEPPTGGCKRGAA